MSDTVNINFTPSSLGSYSINSNGNKVNVSPATNSDEAKINSLSTAYSQASNSITSLASKPAPSLNTDSLSASLNSFESKLSSLENFVHTNVHGKPVNIFPNYWVKAHAYGPHKDMPTFHVPVEQGKQYTLSFMIADQSDDANLAIRASSDWNVADEWGDIVKNDGGASGNKAIYHITFTAPQTGNMPVNFMFCRQASAMSAGINVIMIQRITMTQTDHYVPYQQCDNSKQSLADVTGEAGMDAKAMFGNL